MASLGSAFSRFLSLFILLLHLGCFVFLPRDRDPSSHHPPPTSRKRKTTSPLAGDHSPPPATRLRQSTTATKALVSSWSYIKRVFSCKPTNPLPPPPPLSPALTSARSSQKSIVSMIAPDQIINSFPEEDGATNPPLPPQESDISTADHHFPLRNDIFPCTACGEILPKPGLLEQHLAVKHAVSELRDGDSGNNIVRIIFKAGWSCKEKTPEIRRILKIHNSPKILTRFEEYRELVKSKASKIGGEGRRRDERCIADGNELLRFHCATFVCDLGLNGGFGFGSGFSSSSSLCNQQYCSVCGIIKSGFSPKMDGISTLSTSWRAHAAIPEEIEEEFQFMNVKRAMLVCRVIAGRVGSEMEEEEEEVDKDGGGFDSLMGRAVGGGDDGGGLHHAKLDEEELLVFNPKAVLPCFVIVYTV
ncbi:unnamed protein product [Linum tenue]|uniref:C2H2-type domain-containing protein n=1 Tax=Linum tenue TaxID=586396 RepID=A0AAV0PWM8_9ROSI|nr:unnamed protein product [Linum tenue]CAI0540582.1 unnamed protein product [Linum tenue]